MNADQKLGIAALLLLAAVAALWIWGRSAETLPPGAVPTDSDRSTVTASHLAVRVPRALDRTPLPSRTIETPKDAAAAAAFQADSPIKIWLPTGRLLSLMPGNNTIAWRREAREADVARLIDRAAAAGDMTTVENIAEHANERSVERARAALQWLRWEGGSYTPWPEISSENPVWIVR